MRATALSALFLLASAPALAEPNPDLSRARTELEDLRYDEAVVSLDKALRAGTNTPAQIVEIYRLLGEVEASLGAGDKARAHFEKALSIDPKLSLPDGVSPIIGKPFEAARKALAGKEPLSISYEIQSGGEAIVVVVESDPAGLVVGARVSFQSAVGAEDAMEQPGASRIEVAAPSGAVSFTAAVVDQFGNRLALLGDPDAPIALEAGGLVDGGGDEGGASLLGRWWLWGGAAVVFAAAGGGFGLSAQSAVDDIQRLVDSSEEHEYATDVRPLEKRARRNALIANVGFGVAGACAVVAAVLMIRGGGGEAERDPSALVVPIAGDDALGVTVRLRY